MITSKKKSKKLKQEQKTTQKVEQQSLASQTQKVNIRIGELPAKKKSRKRRQKKTVEVSPQPPTPPSFTPPQTLYPYRPSTMFVQQPPQYQPPPFSSRELTTFLQPLEERLKGIEKSIAQRPFNILRSEQRLGAYSRDPSETSSELSLGSEEYPLVHPIQNFLRPNVGGYTPQNFQYNIPPPPNNPSYFDIPQAFHTPIIQRPSSVIRPVFSEETDSEFGWGSAYFGTEPSSPVPRSEEEREIQRDNQAYLQLSEIQERERERPTSGNLAHQPQIQHTPQYIQASDYPTEEYNEQEVETNVQNQKGGGGDPYSEWLRNSSNILGEVNNRPKVGYSDSLDTQSDANSIVSSERGEHRSIPNLRDELNLQQGLLPQEKLIESVNEVVMNAIQKEKEKEKQERTKRLIEETPEEREETQRLRNEFLQLQKQKSEKEQERAQLRIEAREYGIKIGNSSNETIKKKIEQAKQQQK